MKKESSTNRERRRQANKDQAGTLYDHPVIIAEMIAERFTDDQEIIEKLVKRANYHYCTDASFKRKVNGSGNSGRDFLIMFMKHWYDAKFWLRQHAAESFGVQGKLM
jgi:hypothetical protein